MKAPAVIVPALSLALVLAAPLLAQTSSAPAPATTASAHAPDVTTQKISELVHAGKYVEAQQLTNGLLIAYPNDERLIKAKALIEQLLANPPASTTAVAPVGVEELSGMDRVDRDALIELAREAQQSTDPAQQRKLLTQFMSQSEVFLQKHPKQVLLWQFRAASSIALNQPLDGYEAGQHLLGLGGGNDSNASRLLAQLKNKGWLDKQEATKQDRIKWIAGTWSAHWSWAEPSGRKFSEGDYISESSSSGSLIELYERSNDGSKQEKPVLRGTIQDSGEISWQLRWRSDWKTLPVQVSDDKRTMKIEFTEKWLRPHMGLSGHKWMLCTYTNVLTRQ